MEPDSTVRRFDNIVFSGSCGPPGRTHNHYSIMVWGRLNRCIVFEVTTTTLREAFDFVRDLMRRFPARMVSIGRVSAREDTMRLSWSSAPVRRQFAGDRYVSVLYQGVGWWYVCIDGYSGFIIKVCGFP